MQAKQIAEKMIYLLNNHQFSFSDKAKHVLEFVDGFTFHAESAVSDAFTERIIVKYPLIGFRFEIDRNEDNQNEYDVEKLAKQINYVLLIKRALFERNHSGIFATLHRKQMPSFNKIDARYGREVARKSQKVDIHNLEDVLKFINSF